MITLFVTAAIVALLVILFRWQRKREIAAFLDADVGDLRAALGRDPSHTPVASAIERGVAGQSPVRDATLRIRDLSDIRKMFDVRQPVDLHSRLGAAGSAESLPRGEGREPARYDLRRELFDDVMRSFLGALDEVLDARFRTFVKVPLRELVRVREGPGDVQPLGEVSVVICRREDFSLVCGVQLADASAQSRRRLAEITEIFRQIERPLFRFPLATDYSAPEIRERLGELLQSSA